MMGSPGGLAAENSGTQQQAYIKSSNPDRSDFFGNSVAISGDTMVIAAENEGSAATGINGNQGDNSAPTSGAVYVFIRQDGDWVQQAYIKPSNTGGGDVFGNSGDKFGRSVAIDGNTLVVGAPWEESKATGVNGDQSDDSIALAGAAYVFVRNGTTWSQQAYLKASNTVQESNTGLYSEFGSSVAISGDTVAIGAFGENSATSGINGNQTDTSLPYSGAVYVFTRSGTSWNQQAYIKASNTDQGDLFGIMLDLSGDTLVVSSPSEYSSATGINGNQADNSLVFVGAAYVFTRNGSSWSQQAYLKASNAGKNDRFGSSISIDGDTIVVGAAQETSNATGVNGDESNNTVGRAGAAYVFVRQGNSWTQQAYLKPSNTGFSDHFGSTVAVYGDILAVAAVNESSRATGIDGDQQDDAALDAGAEYLFKRSGNEWRQTEYIKASNTDPGDNFGVSVTLWEDTLIVGANREDSADNGVGANQLDNSVLSTGAVYVYGDLAGDNGFQINAGLNDAWVNEAAGLQGMFITVYPVQGFIFLAWFTFDSVIPTDDDPAVFGASDQRWATGLGTFQGNLAVLDAELTTGGVFNAADPLAVQDTDYGSISLEFRNCNEATVTYNFPSAGESGEFIIQRTLGDNIPLCETLSSE
jgi:drug/metabolite transporter superfamily protein YnfA